MSDDTCAILNEINPEFHARNLTVYMSDDAIFNLADINRTVIPEDERENGSEENSDNLIENIVNNSKELIGNHVVSVVDMPSEKLTLVIDPTNPGIGIYKDGKIYMFSSEDGSGISPRPLSGIMFRASSILDTAKTFANSFIEPDKSIDELKSMYNADALNEILKQVEEIEEKYEESSFNKRYKLDSSLLSSHVSDSDSNNKNQNAKILNNEEIR